MKKRLLAVLATGLFFLCISGMANATLTTIGTAQFGGAGTEYNLIWDNNNNGNSVIWLDYTNGLADWTNQNNWAAGLNDTNVLTYDLDGYQVDWGTNVWRLPSAGASPQLGYNQTTSEMGDLYYNDLELKSYLDRNNQLVTDNELNATNFDNLIASWYWSGTGYAGNSGDAWGFRMDLGSQRGSPKPMPGYGLAVRSGQVSADPVPEPATMLLFSTGLVGLTGFRRWRKGSRV